MAPLVERYADRLQGCLQCFDRLIIWGTLPVVSHVGGMTHFLTTQGLTVADFTDLASALRDTLIAHVRQVAEAAGVRIEYLSSPRSVRKEARIQEILRERGDHPGLVHIFEVTEPCRCFRVLGGGRAGRPHLKADTGKCKHFYVYFIDPRFGLCHLRIPTWVPFHLQFYCNGHSWLVGELQRAGIAFTQADNALVACADWERAQQIADAFPVAELHAALDRYVQQFCPVGTQLDQATYHWSISQAEYATDLVFKNPADLRALYDHLCREVIQAVKATDIATFLGRPLPQEPAEEIGSNLQSRAEGMRVRHQWGALASLKMYDKHGCVLRIETTVNDVSFFKHHREVVHRNGTASLKLAPVRKTIHSLPLLAGILGGCNRRYLAYLATLQDPTVGLETIERLAEPSHEHGRTYRGFNLCARKDCELFAALARGDWSLRGFSNANLRHLLAEASPARVSGLLKRLRAQGLIQRLARSYRYRLTPTGQRVVVAALRLRQDPLVPALAGL